tara:strand:- start:3163 stop:3924 length:762 start_codon:yes stop_codon:yes gene_type:complete
MYQITIRHKGKGVRQYNIFTEDEAKKEGIEYKYWKEAEIGDYAVSDDGYVAMVIQKKKYPGANKNSNTYIRLPWGYAFYSDKYPSKKFKAAGRRSNGTFSGKTQLEVRAGQDNMRNLATAYSIHMNYDLAIDMVFDSTTPQERRKWKRSMKTEVFRKMIREELQKLLHDKGYTESDVIDMLTKGLTMAQDKGDISNYLKVVENIQDMLGMKEKPIQKTTQKLEAYSTRNLLDEIAKEEKTLVAEKVEIKENAK